ncbi:RNA polymerase-associated protein RapA [Halochromatium salexigens]|uniref:RNA polymerase-associated protein RapA n=1 Tax=Halochromatium salexigens TaxID=49447 RepID=A0AAJ0UEW8_HALSE|nr:RNA polymerase-associated protein RapA [Halochromatium salexigens]MBK5930183.1 RNA polymerase-binding ATPase [Halochromatium salexigens]
MSEPVPAFAVGQRWLSETQPELGLGMVEAVEHRRVTLLFPATGERRTYAADNTPLWRAQLAAGELLRDLEGRDLTVVDLLEHNGFVTYLVRDSAGHEEPLPETRIDPRLRLSRPQQRLRAGRLDSDTWFRLRVQALEQTARLATAPTRGLLGARISPIPHQLHIAAEVADRHHPRVLLADEVGLGKTIEAGLILHRLLLAGRVHRVLILVPEPLLHQWLVELLRRFNLSVALFDRKRVQALVRQGANPFESEQRILCSLDLLTEDVGLADAVLHADWDLLICDEAHHLEWSPEASSPGYELVAGLAAKIPAVLLLTATPEQLGRAGHFGRLRLLDPERFGDYAAFLAEEEGYAPVAELVTRLLDETPLSADEQARLDTLLDGDADADGSSAEPARAADTDEAAGELEAAGKPPATEQCGATSAATRERQALIDQLLDRHGTGRVLFRNTRAAISGFPERVLHPARLEAGADADDAGADNEVDPLDALWAAIDDPQGLEQDPRLEWLIARLRELAPAKVLLITTTAETVLDLRRALLERAGIQAAIFHEEMPIVERDRAAAFFADPEEGTQILLCSEIGSEGRNFQFAHHLVLFDLPADPELLEQRIGRLDRIGQTETIRIHVPYRAGTPDELLFRWYHEGLDAFSAHQPAAPAVFWEQRETLQALLSDPAPEPAEIEALIGEAQALRARLDTELAAGRDRLLELSSHRPARGGALVQALEEEDRDPTIEIFLTGLWDAFGVEREPGPGGSLVVRPGAHMLQERFPGLPDEGLTATFNRQHALAHEERRFLTREHPLTRAALELVTGSHLGTSALVLTQDKRFPSSALLLEAVYVAECPAPPALNAQRFLPPTARRMLIDEQGQERSVEIDPDALGGKCLRPRRPLARALLQAKSKVIEAMVTLAEQEAARETRALREQAGAQMRAQLDAELDRLRDLARRNPAVRAEEIAALEAERDALAETLANSRLRLDALRLIAFA